MYSEYTSKTLPIIIVGSAQVDFANEKINCYAKDQRKLWERYCGVGLDMMVMILGRPWIKHHESYPDWKCQESIGYEWKSLTPPSKILREPAFTPIPLRWKYWAHVVKVSTRFYGESCSRINMIIWFCEDNNGPFPMLIHMLLVQCCPHWIISDQ